MVEVIANSLDDTLTDGLSFKLAKAASYITTRRSCTYHPQGSNIYTPQRGTRLIKISINGSDWLGIQQERQRRKQVSSYRRPLVILQPNENSGSRSDLRRH